MKMTKQEALKKIEELQKYISDVDSDIELRHGQAVKLNGASTDRYVILKTFADSSSGYVLYSVTSRAARSRDNKGNLFTATVLRRFLNEQKATAITIDVDDIASSMLHIT